VVALIIGVCIGSIYAMMALGIAIVYRGTHMVNFAQGEMGAIGVFVFIQWRVLGHGNGAIGLILGLLVAGACGVAFGFLVMLMSRTSRSELPPLIASFGFFLAIRAITVAVWGQKEPYELPEFFGSGGWHLSGQIVPFSYLGTLAITVVIGAALFLAARYTKVGIQMRAVVANYDAAELAGIAARRLQLLAWFLGTMLACVAALLYFREAYVVTGNIDLVLIPTFAITAVGGFEHFGAIAIAAIIYGVANQLLSQYTTFAGSSVVALGVLVVLLFITPRGILVARSQRYS
jgi:branched-subunit amino acid ABC-type transport system permease component